MEMFVQGLKGLQGLLIGENFVSVHHDGHYEVPQGVEDLLTMGQESQDVVGR